MWKTDELNEIEILRSVSTETQMLLNKPSSILRVERNDYFSFLFSLVPSEEKFNFFPLSPSFATKECQLFWIFSVWWRGSWFWWIGVCLLPILLYLSHSLTLFAFSHFTFFQLMFDCLLIFYWNKNVLLNTYFVFFYWIDWIWTSLHSGVLIFWLHLQVHIGYPVWGSSSLEPVGPLDLFPSFVCQRELLTGFWDEPRSGTKPTTGEEISKQRTCILPWCSLPEGPPF